MATDQRGFFSFFFLSRVGHDQLWEKTKNGILLPKLLWPTVRRNCSSDWEKLSKFEAEGREFAKIMRSLEQFIQTVKGQKISGNRMLF